jgi:hypothetical protein
VKLYNSYVLLTLLITQLFLQFNLFLQIHSFGSHLQSRRAAFSSNKGSQFPSLLHLPLYLLLFAVGPIVVYGKFVLTQRQAGIGFLGQPRKSPNTASQRPCTRRYAVGSLVPPISAPIVFGGSPDIPAVDTMRIPGAAVGGGFVYEDFCAGRG